MSWYNMNTKMGGEISSGDRKMSENKKNKKNRANKRSLSVENEGLS